MCYSQSDGGIYDLCRKNDKFRHSGLDLNVLSGLEQYENQTGEGNLDEKFCSSNKLYRHACARRLRG